jgi:PKD repeat protein
LIGGSGIEEAASIQQTSDHGYILLGHTSSSASGDIHGTNRGAGMTDLWVVKLLENGVIEWERLLGGFAAEYGDSIQQTADGGYVLLGQTGSLSGSGDIVGTYHGEFDLWVVNLSAVGEIRWQTLLGGDTTEHGISLQQTTDGGYILAGDTTSSANGDVVETSHGGSDLWILKLGPTGRIAWQQLLGGLGNEQSSSLRPTADGGFVMLGSTTSSLSGDVADKSQGYSDLWTLKLDGSGAVRWQALYGGSGYEYGRAVYQAADGGYILLSDSTSSAGGDVTRTNHAISSGQDIWIVKLTATPVRVVPGGRGAPTNTHAGGPYEDVNGNGRADFADVVLYFNQMSWIAANEPISAFDYNANGRIDFADVVWLFNHL